MIAGYYSYGCTAKKIKMRLIKIIKIMLFAIACWLAYEIVVHIYSNDLMSWLTANFTWKTPIMFFAFCTIDWAIPLLDAIMALPNGTRCRKYKFRHLGGCQKEISTRLVQANEKKRSDPFRNHPVKTLEIISRNTASAGPRTPCRDGLQASIPRERRIYQAGRRKASHSITT